MSHLRPFRLPGLVCSILAVVLALLVLAPVASAQEQPKRGGTLVAGLASEPPHLNPAVGTDTVMLTIAGQTYGTLVRQDADLSVRPDLAERWEISPDKMTYTFFLRKNVKWHDGKPFTSADVKFSLMEVNYKYNGLASTIFASVESVDTPDPYTVIFKLKYPYAPFFPWAVAHAPTSMIVPKHIFEGSDPTKNDFNFKPVGTGPFIFKEWVKGSHITLERNPDYYLPGLPYLDRIVWKVVPDNAARLIALEKGEVDYLSFIAFPDTAVKPTARIPGLEVMNTDRPSYAQVIGFFNLRNPPLSNKLVRQAIAHALDKKALIDRALDGGATPGSSPIPAQLKEFYNPNIPKYDYNVARSNQLLDQAGFPRKADGNRFDLRISFRRGGDAGAHDTAAEVMREQLRAVGVNVQLQPMDAAAWTETAFVKWDFDITLAGIQCGPDPAIGVARLYLTENIQRLASRNLMGYSNPKVDELFKAAEREPNPTRRAELYKEIQPIMVDEIPALWLWEKHWPVAFRKPVKGMPYGAMQSEPMDRVWLTTAEGGQAGVQTTAIAVAAAAAIVILGGALLVVRRRRSA